MVELAEYLQYLSSTFFANELIDVLYWLSTYNYNLDEVPVELLTSEIGREKIEAELKQMSQRSSGHSFVRII